MKINLPSEPYVVVTEKDALAFLDRNWDAYKYDILERIEEASKDGLTAKEMLETFADENHDDIVDELELS